MVKYHLKFLTYIILSVLLLALIVFNSFEQTKKKQLKDLQQKITNPSFNSTFPQTFEFKNQQFYLNGNPLYIAAGEIHYCRLPSQYWRTRIQTIKALGLNTLSVYIMWNYHERIEGQFDFESPDRNLRNFLQIAKEEQMYVLIRPGPYIDSEWDLGGHPYYLLKQQMKLRSTDDKYIQSITNYIKEVSEQIKDYQITTNGTILMLQIENEYGYIGQNNSYPLKLVQLWENTNNIKVPYYSADEGRVSDIGHIPNGALGLNPGIEQKWYDFAHQIDNQVPVFSSETYPGWLTHWGEQQWGGKDINYTVNMFENILQNKWSFSMYMVYGGSNFGLYSGADNDGKDTQYQPVITSYDYDAPINEQGSPTEKYFALRQLFSNYFAWEFPQVPQIINTIDVSPFLPSKAYSLFDILSQTKKIYLNKPTIFEDLDQNQGIIAYSFNCTLNQGTNVLSFDKIRDVSRVYLNENKVYLGTINRLNNQNNITFSYNGEKSNNIELLVIVEAYGHVDFGPDLYDQKGILGNIYINGQAIQGIFGHQKVPLETFPKATLSFNNNNDIETFFEGKFDLKDSLGDTYLNMKNWKRGYVWVNGFNLGRFWNIGPQFKLYCPSTILKQKDNTIVVFDLEQNQGDIIFGEKNLR